MEIPVRSQFDSMHWMFTVLFDAQAFFGSMHSRRGGGIGGSFPQTTQHFR